jgi:uncharacterized UPF0160 family protein
MKYLKNFMPTKINKLITHNGSFHSDDIFACATLCLMLEKKGEKFEIVRTRDEEVIKAGEYVFDVGGIYDENVNRFDHHQPGGAGARSGIEYSSFGLVWKKFGLALCGEERVANMIDQKLVAPVDAHDNGLDLVSNLYETSPYFIQNFFHSMRPTLREENITNDEMFFKSVEIAKEILTREIIHAQDTFFAQENVVKAYQNSADKRIIVLDDKYPFQYTLGDFSEPLFVIYPRKITSDWGVGAVRDNPKTFKNRKNFPKSWGGLRNEEMAKVSGVQDAIFCHRGLFLAVAKSKEGAIKLAQIAVES